MKICFFIVILLSANSFAMEPCTVLASDDTVALPTKDGLRFILDTAKECPQNILQLEAAFVEKNWSLRPYMVANRGRKNPRRGSFSFFEIAQGTMPNGVESEIFLGHFTALEERYDQNFIVLDQTPVHEALLIEAMAFDEEKGLYNFYELIGQGRSAQWFYRGDSIDALLDNQYLHRIPPEGQKKFGERMRCSACHNSGGPIMKEISTPHNDWWLADRQLIFTPNILSDEVRQRVNRLHDANDFSNSVIVGAAKLERSSNYQSAKRSRSWQEILRPLFCATEINLESSELSVDTDEDQFKIPASFVINPLVLAPTFSFSTSDYRDLLDHFKIRFPETNEKDADHMWLTPVVSIADRHAIKALIANNVISEKIALDILMIDFKNPLFSKTRCGLLRLVPNTKDDWFLAFVKNLRDSNSPEAIELLKYLDEEDSFVVFHEPTLSSYVESMQRRENLELLFRRLMDLREQAFVDEISKNPRGQILEPGFRVIFPKPSR